MKKTLSLFKILLNSWYGISVFKSKVSKNSRELLKLAGMIVVLVVSLSPLLAGYIELSNVCYDQLSALGQGGAIITLGVVISSLLVLLFGFLYVISSFYFSSDTEHLISMPLKPSSILGAKFGVILVTEYMTELPLLLPPVIIYGARSGAGVLYWIYSVVAVLLIPVIPLCLTSIIAVIIMRFTNIGKKRDLFRTVGSIIGIFLIFGLEFAIQHIAERGGNEAMTAALFAEDGFVSVIARDFPPAKWISLALVDYSGLKGVLYLLLFCALAGLFLFAFEWSGEKLFLGGYLGGNEIAAKRRRVDQSRFSTEIRPRDEVSAIFWREFKILNRVPIYFMNCVFVIFLLPVIFVITPLMGGEGSLGELEQLAHGAQGVYIATLVGCGIALFTSAANMTAPTSISREGADFFISKYIPVSPTAQITGKLEHALTLGLVGDLLTVFALWFVLRLNPANIALAFLLSAAATVPVTEIGLMIDLFRPYLNWDNPQKAVKQNLNGVVSMFFNSLWAGGLLFLAGRFISNHAVAYALLIAVFAMLGAVLYKVLVLYAERRYPEIE